MGESIINEAYIRLSTDGKNTIVDYSDIQTHTIANLLYALLIKMPQSRIPMEVALNRYISEHEIQ